MIYLINGINFVVTKYSRCMKANLPHEWALEGNYFATCHLVREVTEVQASPPFDSGVQG